ncbi:PREDICTED: putative uncharacterized protein ENSP00000383309 [Galeopterus variegatus]|uniref:Uncharacterized protein n=1 Tax=Galeopterus variegatus TaxID=482537 RepID=A0ABM0R4W8_GALVR|nr:PREDICTED: putative uncharacterized protein ENSP00000383309 [Galeopterus variegatus]
MRGWLLATGGLERNPHPDPEGRDSPRERWAPRSAPGPASLESAEDPAGSRKEGSRRPQTTRALPCLKERDPNSGSSENGKRGDRTPVRAGAHHHWLPPPSPATMAGRSLPSMTVADGASLPRRLRCPARTGAVPGRPAEPLPPRPPFPRTPEKRLPGACSLRTRTGRRRPVTPPLLTLPSRGWVGGSGEGARTAQAGSACASARAPSRDRWDPALGESRELANGLKVPGTFLLRAQSFALCLAEVRCHTSFSLQPGMSLSPQTGKMLEQKEGTGAQNLARKHPPGSRRGGPDVVHAPHVVLGSDAGLWRSPARGRQSGVAMGGASDRPAEPGEEVEACCWSAMTASCARSPFTRWPGPLSLSHNRR